MTNALTKHQLWTQQSSSSTNTPPNDDDDFDTRRKRASTAFGHYKSEDDVSQNKYRALSAQSEMK
jgi:hypothetical protein